MFKSATLLAIGLAVASAQFLSSDVERFLQTSNSSLTSATAIGVATCNRTATTEPCAASQCCLGVTKNGTAVSATTGICAPIGFASLTFNNVSGLNYTFSSCSVAATTTAWNATLGCTNCSTSQCCATRSWTLGGVSATGAASASSCQSNSTIGAGDQVLVWTNYTSASQVGAVDAKSLGTCAAASTGTTGSFGAYIKASAMLVVAMIAATFF